MISKAKYTLGAAVAVLGMCKPLEAVACIQVPTSCKVTSAFGGRYNPITKNYSTEFHHGVDFGCPVGTPVSAAETGIVTMSGFSSSAGNWVVVRSPGSTSTVFKYMHHDRNKATIGQTISKGQEIALTGNTGRSSGPHLHFQVDVNNVAVDPFSQFCTRPPMKDGVLQGEDQSDLISQTTQATEPTGGPAPALGLDGSLDEILGDVIASRALNPDYARQISTLPTDRLYAELAYIQTIRLKVQRERSIQRERIEAIQAMLQLLYAEETLKPALGAQRKSANQSMVPRGN